MKKVVARFAPPIFVGLFTALIYLCANAWMHYLFLTKRQSGPVSYADSHEAIKIDIDVFAATAIALLIILILHSLVAEQRAATLLANTNGSQQKLRLQAQKMTELAQKARKASKAKSDFLAMMSHDLRTPMNAIIGYSDILATTELSDEQSSCATAITLACDNMLGLINDILDLTRLETGKMELRKVEYSPLKLLQSVAKVIDIIAEKNNNTVSIQVDEALDVALFGDAERINQVLLNLAGNAAKFTKDGEVILKATLIERDGNIRFTVCDTGDGIPDELKPRLFQPFEQGENGHSAGKDSSGLGLAISDRLVRLMGGKIACQSSIGFGSTFFFDLPYVVSKSANQVVAGPKLDCIIFDLTGRTVLVADDTPANLFVAKAILEKIGMVVTTVTNGEAAILAAQSSNFDIMFIDIQMPGLSGIEVVSAIRTMNGRIATTPLVALTAQSFQRDRERALAGGFDAFLSKPMRAVDLQRMAVAMLHKKAAMNTTNHTAIEFDHAAFVDLADAVGANQLPQLIGRFERDVNEQLGGLMQHHAEPGCANVTNLAHKLAGLLSQFGLVSAAELAKIIEHKDPAMRESLDLERIADTSRSGLQMVRQLMNRHLEGELGKAA